MGVSRSASTVMAYAMKQYQWTLEQVRTHRVAGSNHSPTQPRSLHAYHPALPTQPPLLPFRTPLPHPPRTPCLAVGRRAQAYSYVKKRRSIVKPNEGFREQLLVYEGILRAKRQSGSWGKRVAAASTAHASRRHTPKFYVKVRPASRDRSFAASPRRKREPVACRPLPAPALAVARVVASPLQGRGCTHGAVVSLRCAKTCAG